MRCKMVGGQCGSVPVPEKTNPPRARNLSNLADFRHTGRHRYREDAPCPKGRFTWFFSAHDVLRCARSIARAAGLAAQLLWTVVAIRLLLHRGSMP